MTNIENLATALNGRPKPGGGFLAQCPAHDDRHPSLSIDVGDSGTLLLKCFSGCPQEAVIDALKIKDLWPEGKGNVLSDEELRQAQQRSEQRQAERQKKCIKAATIAQSVWKAASPALPDHPYLVRKKVQPTNTLREIDLGKLAKLIGYHPQANGEPLAAGRVLVAPVMIDGKICTVEMIDQNGRKHALAGGKKSSGFWATGKLPGVDGDGIRLLIGEGIATCLSAMESTGFLTIAALSCGNLLSVARQLRERYPKAEIILLADIIKATDEPNPHAVEAVAEIGGRLAIPDFGPERAEGMTDFNDLAELHGREAVKTCIEGALLREQTTHCGTVADEKIHRFPETQGCGVVADTSTLPTSSTIEEIVFGLAAMPTLEYALIRKDKAKSLGLGVADLDRAVKEARKGCSSDNDLPFREVEPCLLAVDPKELLFEIVSVVQRFIVCDDHIPYAVALWSAMTWFMDVVDVAPLAIITAPEKRCGKTQLLTLLGRLVCRPITASSISPAAMFRAIDAWKPALMIDEVDACMKDNEELRGIINSGHTRDSAYVIRAVGETFTPTKFSTWGAKALSGIGHVADTLMDRAIILELRRKLPYEEVDRLRHAEPGLFDILTAKLARFALDYSDKVRQARPYLPPSLNDRAQDNWEPLLAIAIVAGSEWLEIATKTALKISGSESDAQSIGVELLADIQEVFEEKMVDRISTAELIKALCEDEEKPWATYNRGMPIKPRQLAGRLKGHGISSKTIRLGSAETPKGYDKKQFDEAFSRYIPSPPSVSATTPQTNIHKGSGVADMPTRCGSVADKNLPRCPETLDCGAVADRAPLVGSSEKIEIII